MEFADLFYEYLKERGIEAHIQPGFSTPRFVPEYPRNVRKILHQEHVRAVQIENHWGKGSPIHILLHSNGQIYMRYRQLKQRARARAKPEWLLEWEDFGNIHNQSILELLTAKIRDILRRQRARSEIC